eukprot:Gb_22905 [translate_table: standard]
MHGFLQLVSELSVEDLGEPVGLTMWELSDPHRSITIGSGCIWSKFIFCVTGRPGSCMVTGVLVNLGFRLGIITGCSWFVADGEPQTDIECSVCRFILKAICGEFNNNHNNCMKGCECHKGPWTFDEDGSHCVKWLWLDNLFLDPE